MNKIVKDFFRDFKKIITKYSSSITISVYPSKSGTPETEHCIEQSPYTTVVSYTNNKQIPQGIALCGISLRMVFQSFPPLWESVRATVQRITLLAPASTKSAAQRFRVAPVVHRSSQITTVRSRTTSAAVSDRI